MNGTRWSIAAAVSALAITCAACDDSTKPQDTFNAQAAQADYDALAHIYASAGWQSFSVLAGGAVTTGPLPALVTGVQQTTGLAAGRSDLRAQAAAVDMARALWTAGGHPGATPNFAVIPSELLGKTLVYDAGSDVYVVDPERPGAPSNGVRYILYAINPVTHEVVVGEEIGYADLTDEGVEIPNGFKVRLVGVTGTLTFVDYTATVTGTLTSGTIVTNGFLSDGVNTLNYTVTAVGSVSSVQSSLDLTYALDIASVGFTASGAIHGSTTEGDSTLTYAQTVVAGGSSFQIDATVTTTTFDATVDLNGSLFAQATGTPQAIVLSDAEGHLLSAEEYKILGDILGVSGAVTLTTVALLAPVAYAIGGGQPPS